ISKSGQPSLSPRASVAPTNPQTPVIRIRMMELTSLRHQPLAPGGNDLLKDSRQAAGDPPLRIVRLHFPQIAVVTDVVTGARLVHVSVTLLFAGTMFRHHECFQD